MQELQSSEHFVSFERIPLITEHDSLVTAFRTLGDSSAGGLIVLEVPRGESPRVMTPNALLLGRLMDSRPNDLGWYVTGAWLKAVYARLLEPANRPLQWQALTLSTLLRQYRAGGPGEQEGLMGPAHDSRDVGEGPISLSGVAKAVDDQPPIRIEGVVRDDEHARPLQERPDAVFLIRGENGRPLGWFLNHEHVVATFNTPPPVFECTRGHPNPDPDNGRCYKCPARIKS